MDFQSVQEESGRIENPSREIPPEWRSLVPFIIRLRDYPDGELPRPQDYPLKLAKELPDAPPGWMDRLLKNGRALLMFDGVDEVPRARRGQVLAEIRQLLKTYPGNAFVVTTRPEAVERAEFQELGFLSARVEPLSPQDRTTFIDRWHEAMEVRLRKRNEPQDLRPVAQRLQERLDETPAIARLTISPLLCAAVCALHLRRAENLPETPVDLCEKLSEMLREDPSFQNALGTFNPASFTQVLQMSGLTEAEYFEDQGDAARRQQLILSLFGDTQLPETASNLINRYVADDEVPEIFGRCMAVVLPYIEVTQSGVVQIALGLGKPVISTTVGCLPEIIKEGVNGLLVPSADVTALKKAIVHMAENCSEAQEMGQRGQVMADSEYSWDRIADMTLGVYDEIKRR